MEGYPPKNASCIDNGYWVRAAKISCKVKKSMKTNISCYKEQLDEEYQWT